MISLMEVFLAFCFQPPVWQKLLGTNVCAHFYLLILLLERSYLVESPENNNCCKQPAFSTSGHWKYRNKSLAPEALSYRGLAYFSWQVKTTNKQKNHLLIYSNNIWMIHQKIRLNGEKPIPKGYLLYDSLPLSILATVVKTGDKTV